MEKQPVILCGKSVLMDGLAITLKNRNDFQVITALDPAEIEQMLEILESAAVIVDSAAGRDWFETLIRRYPAAFIIAVNPESSAAMVYSQDQVSTIDDLKNMIKKRSQLRRQSGSAMNRSALHNRLYRQRTDGIIRERSGAGDL